MKYQDWPTKDEAAKAMGVSVKTLERMADAGKIEQQFRPRPGRSDVAVFNPKDVEREASRRAAAVGVPFIMPSDAPGPELVKRSRSEPPAIGDHLEHRDILSLKEVRRLKGWPEEYLVQLANQGKIRFYHVPGCRGRMVRRRELEILETIELMIWEPRPKALSPARNKALPSPD